MALRRSRSLFGNDRRPAPSDAGYLDPDTLKKNVVSSAVDDDDEELDDKSECPNNSGKFPWNSEHPEGSITSELLQQGGPFSALTPSMWPSKGIKLLR